MQFADKGRQFVYTHFTCNLLNEGSVVPTTLTAAIGRYVRSTGLTTVFEELDGSLADQTHRECLAGLLVCPRGGEAFPVYVARVANLRMPAAVAIRIFTHFADGRSSR